MTRDYLKFMTSDLLMQFRGEECKNNETLLSALAKQLDDVFEMFQQLETRTFLPIKNKDDASLNIGAQKVHLDRIGEIVDITRKQATIVSSKLESVSDIEKSQDILNGSLMNFIKDNFSMYYPGYALSDSEYREYLYYKIFLNNSYCTYSDVIKSLEMFWNKTPIYYQEKPEEPATIYLSTPELKPEHNARLFFLAPVVKAAGVQLFRSAATKDYDRIKNLYLGSGLFNGIIQSEIPPLTVEHKYNNTLVPSSRMENVVEKNIEFISEDYFNEVYVDNDLLLGFNYYKFDNTQSCIIFPVFYNGKLVKGISGPNSISGNYPINVLESVCSVFIPDTYEYIYKFPHLKQKIKEIRLPKKIKHLGRKLFTNIKVSRIVIPFDSEIEEIGMNTFDAIDLEVVTIPKSVKKIGYNAINGAYTSGVTINRKIIYGGTKSEWNEIDINYDNFFISEAEIVYLGGDE